MAAPESAPAERLLAFEGVAVRINGKPTYLWRAIDDEGGFSTSWSDADTTLRSALRLIRKLLNKQGFAPKLLMTDKLRSYASAFRRLRLTCRHEDL